MGLAVSLGAVRMVLDCTAYSARKLPALPQPAATTLHIRHR